MELEFWASTDVGRVRDHNEDNFLVDKRMKLFVVCDGMGGHAAGEVASAMGVQIVREVVNGHREVFETLAAEPESLANRKSVLKLMEHAISEACARIYKAAQEDSAKRGMGTTCSALLLAEGRCFIGHVGDSRIYLYRQEKIHQITEDHSLINEMIRLGKIKPGEEHHLPHKNAVTRAVGVNEFVEVDTFELDVQAGDAFLICSDGLSGYFKNDDHIVDLMEIEDPKKITERSIEFANAGGGKDNITSIVVRVTSDESQKRDIQKTMEVLRVTPYFQYLAYKEMVQIVNLSKHRKFAEGEQIFDEDSDPGAMFVITQGSVRVERGGRTVAKLLTGDTLAETSIIDDTPQNFGAVAIEDVTVLAFERQQFVELLRADPSVAVKLLWNFLQTFAFHIRSVPYETFLGERASKPDEHTPPSGTLVFNEDRKSSEGRSPKSSGEFVSPPTEAVAQDKIQAKAKADARRSRDKDSRDAAGSSDNVARETDSTEFETVKIGRSSRADRTIRTRPTEPVGRDTIAEMNFDDPDATLGDEDFQGGIKDTIPARSAFTTDELAWDDIIPSDLLEDEASLRKTVQMDGDIDEKARTHPALGRNEQPEPKRASRPAATTPGNGIGKAISGESVVRASTPQAQVLKRTKMIVGEDHGFESAENPRDVKPIEKREPDSTLELDIADENVEELPDIDPRRFGIAVLVLTLVSIAGCKTREVGGAPSTDGEVVFSDDFDRSEVGDKWERGTGEGGRGEWKIVDGWLRAESLRNDPLWFVDRLPAKTRIEFDAKALSPTGDLKVEIFGDGRNHASGYILIFGGWSNSLDVIARLDEHGEDRKSRTSQKVVPEQVYHFAIERRDNAVRWFVNGAPFMTYPDSEPLRGPKNGYFAFSNWEAPVAFDNFEVYRLR